MTAKIIHYTKSTIQFNKSKSCLFINIQSFSRGVTDDALYTPRPISIPVCVDCDY